MLARQQLLVNNIGFCAIGRKMFRPYGGCYSRILNNNDNNKTKEIETWLYQNTPSW